VVHGGDFLHPNALISAAVSYIEDYHQAMKLEEEEEVVEGDRMAGNGHGSTCCSDLETFSIWFL
jgi:hypothetical protein